MLPQAAAVEKRFPAYGTFLRSAALVSNMENQVRLFGVTSTALTARERSILLRLMTRGSRIPIAKALLVASQMTGKGEILATVLAVILSFTVLPSYRVREQL